MPSILSCLRVEVGRRRVQSAIAVVLTAVPAVAQTQLWVHRIASPGDDQILAGAADGTGGVFAAGFTGQVPAGPSGNVPTNALLARYGMNGDLLWMRRFGSGNSNATTCAAEDGAGGVFLAGHAFGSGGVGPTFPSQWMARFDSAGNARWVLPQPPNFTARQAAVDSLGGYLLCGIAVNGGQFNPWVGRFDSSGAQIWGTTVSVFPSIDDEAFAVAPDGTGGAYVCGAVWVGGLNDDAWLVRVDSAGTVLWSVQLATPEYDVAFAVAPDVTGGVFVGGHSIGYMAGPSQSHVGAWYGRFDANGNALWLAQPEALVSSWIRALAPDGSGGVMAGITINGWAHLARILDSGEVVYVHKMKPSAGTAVAFVVPDGANGVFAGGAKGTLANPANPDAWLARYDGSCNSGKTYCTESSTSIPGCTASLTATGSPTLSDPSAWTVSSGPVPGGNLGLLLFGSSGPDSTPYGTLGGKLCVAAPTIRCAPKMSGGDSGQCNGSYAFTLADLIAAAPVVTSGQTIDAQVWARDPANADGFLLSDGVEVTICP